MPANTSITLLDGIKGIANNAFYDCTNLTSVTIPDSVTSIGDRAFSGCTGLTSVTFPWFKYLGYTDGSFDGDLLDKYFKDGAGTYTRSPNGSTWTKVN